jgi:hypothetical protein
MEHDHGHETGHVEPSGAQVREHWATWQWFTGMTKTGIILVAIVVIVAVFFVTR